MRKPYHSELPKNITTISKQDPRALARFLTRQGQALLPLVELIEQSKLAVDELIDVLGRASIEAVLRLSAQGLDPQRRYLFVIDGSKALRAAIHAVFGGENPVQRCRHHKIENVMSYLPKHLKPPVKAALRAAFRLSAAEGMARLEKQAQWLEREYPDAAASLREGLEEMFTLNRLGLPPSLGRCLASTNIIESPHSGVRLRTRRICRWRDGRMVLRWAAAAFLMTEKNFRKIQGYRDLWMLRAVLNPSAEEKQLTTMEQVA